MSNVVKFWKFRTASGDSWSKRKSAAAEISFRILNQDDGTQTKVSRDPRSILLLLELAAFQLRRAGTMTTDPDLMVSLEDYLSSAEKLIEMARRKASQL